MMMNKLDNIYIFWGVAYPRTFFYFSNQQAYLIKYLVIKKASLNNWNHKTSSLTNETKFK